MPLSWNEIKDRALAFSREWAKDSSEDTEANVYLLSAILTFAPELRSKSRTIICQGYGSKCH